MFIIPSFDCKLLEHKSSIIYLIDSPRFLTFLLLVLNLKRNLFIYVIGLSLFFSLIVTP